MRWCFVLAWAAAQIAFARLLLASFLSVERSRREAAGVSVGAWLLTAAYGLFDVGGLHGYLMYLLAVVLIVLSVHGEHGARGLSLLVFAFLIPVIADMAVGRLADGMEGLPFYLTVTGGKALPVVMVLVLRYFKLLSKDKSAQDTDRDMLLLRQHMELQQESMSALEQSYRLQRKSTHEFEHHMQVLSDLLEREENAAARDYLSRLKKNRSIRSMSVSANHPVVDVILNQKYQTARENGIIMQLQVNDLSSLTIPGDSLTVVLTNLLDNAIEACRRRDGHREIICSLLWDEGLYLSIRNTSEPVAAIDGKLPTTKPDSLSHGFGLLSVTYVLDQLGAEYTFGYAEGWFSFAAEIE